MGGVDVSASGPSSPAVSGLMPPAADRTADLLITRQTETPGSSTHTSPVRPHAPSAHHRP